MKPSLSISVQLKQTLFGKLLMGLKIPYLLVWFGVSKEKAVDIIARTYKVKVDNGGWRALF